jgi:hypothetical protein
MQLTNTQGRFETMRRDLVLILLASLAVAVVLTIVLADGSALTQTGFAARDLLAATILVAAACGTAGVVWYRLATTRSSLSRSREEAQTLRRSLLMNEAIIKAEPQVLIYWEQGQGLSIVAATLTTVAGLP